MRRGKWFLPQRGAAHGGKQECVRLGINKELQIEKGGFTTRK